MNFKGQNRRMFRKPGAAKRALGILASSPELMNSVEPIRMQDGGAVELARLRAEIDQGQREYAAAMNFPSPVARAEGMARASGRIQRAQDQLRQLGQTQKMISQAQVKGAEMASDRFSFEGTPLLRDIRAGQEMLRPSSLPLEEQQRRRREAVAAAMPSVPGPQLSALLEQKGRAQSVVEREQQLTDMLKGPSSKAEADSGEVVQDFGLFPPRFAKRKDSDTRSFFDRFRNTELFEQKERAEDFTARQNQLTEMLERKPISEGAGKDNSGVLSPEALADRVARGTGMVGADDRANAREVLREQGQDPNLADDDNFWQYVTLAGLGMAAGESPNAITNIAKGLLVGLDAFREDKKQKADTAFERYIKTEELGISRRLASAQEARAEAERARALRGPDNTAQERMAAVISEYYGIPIAQASRYMVASDMDKEGILMEGLPEYKSNEEAAKKIDEHKNFKFIVVDGKLRPNAAYEGS